ncbi:hypothetical protein [Nitrospirillum sp. BR 11163]|uniref:hypothetical protein n=1 Tax=Nitrospirillum sp. BR 11163 TaxID=3104323 RepID=UPI002AFE75AB|nr:hypothetical protein [Nitrospirillum sp. BR 11163]MEA1677405.1 hypothetical protein [Nitrospirillum sp. BR 11163]
MFSDLDLVELVKAEMADLMARHGLELAVIGKGEVLLRRTDYPIKLMAGREEIHLVYFDKKAGPIRGYNVFLYLMHQRRARLISSMEEAMPVQGYTGHIERELRALTRQLTVAGQDILEGSTEWTKTYHWPTLTLDAETAALL